MFSCKSTFRRILNSRGWSQIDPGLERQLNAMGRTQVPPKYQKRFY